MQTVEGWTTWKEFCALKFCPEATQQALKIFAYSRFKKFTDAFASTTNASDSRSRTVPADDAWHYFESGLRLRDSREGKSYKSWLFYRAGLESEPTLDRIQGGATLLMRDIVREYLRAEFSDRRMTSIDNPLNATKDQAFTLHDLIPAPLDTLNEVEIRELTSMAIVEAKTVFDGLSYAERVALLARELNLPFSHPAVMRAAHRDRCTLITAYDAARTRLADHVRFKHNREEMETLARLTAITFTNLKELSILWGKLDKQCAKLFLLVEN